MTEQTHKATKDIYFKKSAPLQRETVPEHLRQRFEELKHEN